MLEFLAAPRAKDTSSASSKIARVSSIGTPKTPYCGNW